MELCATHQVGPRKGGRYQRGLCPPAFGIRGRRRGSDKFKHPRVQYSWQRGLSPPHACLCYLKELMLHSSTWPQISWCGHPKVANFIKFQLGLQPAVTEQIQGLVCSLNSSCTVHVGTMCTGIAMFEIILDALATAWSDIHPNLEINVQGLPAFTVFSLCSSPKLHKQTNRTNCQV